MTAPPSPEHEIASLVATLTPEQRRDFVEGLSPQDYQALPFLLPPDRASIAAARAEASDGLAWLRTIAPDMMPLPPGPQHRTLAEAISPDGPTGGRIVIVAFRGGGKSTMATTGLSLLAAVRLSHRFIVILRETLPEAVSVVDGIRKFLESRPSITDAYPHLRPLPGEKSEIHTVGGTIILARGAHGAIRGLQRMVAGAIVRPDLVIADDVYDDQAARSTLQTDRLQDWLLGTVGGLAGPAGAETSAPMDVVLIGTTIERDDLVSRMADGSGPFASWRRARYPAEGRVVPTDEATTVPNTLGAPDGPLCVADTEGVVTSIPVPPGASRGDRVAAWPQGAPLGYLDTLTDTKSETFIGSRPYAREYLLRPRVAEDVLFPEAHTRYITNLRDHLLEGVIDCTRVAVAVDPSTGEGDDFAAVVVTALLRLGDVAPDVPDEVADWSAIAVLEAHRGKWTLPVLLSRIEGFAAAWLPLGARVTFETNGGFKWGAQELRRRRIVSVRAVTADRDKYTRASPMTVWHEAGRVFADHRLRGSDWSTDFHGFTGTDADDHDDMTDATVYGATYSTSAWRKR